MAKRKPIVYVGGIPQELPEGDQLQADLVGEWAPLTSPEFTGTPKTVTPPRTDDSEMIANTAFVKEVVDAAILAGGGSNPFSPEEIKALYESNPNTNAFTDLDRIRVENLSEETEWNGDGTLPVEFGGTGNKEGAASKLATPRTMFTNLQATTSPISFDGTQNAILTVSGTLQPSNGGTGLNTLAPNIGTNKIIATDNVTSALKYRDIDSIIDNDTLVFNSDTGKISRFEITQDRIIYVRVTGNNNNDGLSNTTPVATLARALQIANNTDPKHFRVCIDLGAGTFVSVHNNYVPHLNHRNFFIQGAGNDLTTLTGNFDITSSLSISNLNLTDRMQVLDTVRIAAYNGTNTIKVTGVNNIAALTAQYNGDLILIDAIIEVTGTFTEVLVADNSGNIICNGGTTFFLSGNPTFNTAFARASRSGSIHFYTCIFTGNGTGRKYTVYQGGIISGQAANADLTTLPGTIAGDVRLPAKGAFIDDTPTFSVAKTNTNSGTTGAQFISGLTATYDPVTNKLTLATVTQPDRYVCAAPANCDCSRD